MAVMVHPDKNHHPRAEEAFKVLCAAWDIVSNAEKRKEYEMKGKAENELSRSVNEFLSKLQDDLKEAVNTLMCGHAKESIGGLRWTRNLRVPDTMLRVIGCVPLRKETFGQSQACWASRSPALH